MSDFRELSPEEVAQLQLGQEPPIPNPTTPPAPADEPKVQEEEYKPEEIQAILEYASNGRFKDPKDIEGVLAEFERIKSEYEALQNDFKVEEDEEILTLAEFKKQGKGGLRDYVEYLNIDTEKPEKELLWDMYRLQQKELVQLNPTMARKQFEKDFAAKYGVDEDAEPDEKEEALFRLQAAKLEATKYLKGVKEQMIPKVEKKVPERLQKRQELIDQHYQKVNEIAPTIEKYELGEGDAKFVLDLKETVDTPLGKASRQSLAAEFMKEPQTTLVKLVTVDGKPSYEKLARIASLIVSPETALQKAIEHGIELGKAEYIREQKNPSATSFDKGKAPQGANTLDQALREIF